MERLHRDCCSKEHMLTRPLAINIDKTDYQWLLEADLTGNSLCLYSFLDVMRL